MSKVAVITGASGGIGAAAARRLAAQGCYVVLGYCRSREKAESLCRELREAGGEGVSFRADLTKAEEAKALIDFAVEQYGHLDILVNNAGISQIKLFTDITPEDWRQMFAANVDGIYHCCRAAVPYLVQQHSGTIINVSSIWGLCGASCEVH
ncbi:MAG TPA: 3-oxoacyl-ACP reductase, partial [Ruminococcaceae bacterium]|nr:3-oxoacyl-ACP reductase [Oscillospiraceae bacterium]